MRRQLITQSLRMLGVMSLLFGLIYPLLVTGVSQLFFPRQANGSLLRQGETIVGSELLAQKFSGPGYFWPRPSAVDFNPLPSGGSNLGWSSAALQQRVGNSDLPADLLFASGSGLDPHISPTAALWQVERVVAARHWSAEKKQKLLDMIGLYTEPASLRLIGEARVNVLKLNMALDGI